MFDKCQYKFMPYTLIAYRLIGAFFILAAVNKAISLYRTEEVFLFLGFPASMIAVFSWALVTYEIALGLSIILSICDRLVAKVVIITLLIFSSVIAVLLWKYPNAPPCNCSGNLNLFSTAFGDNLFGIFRNLVLLAISILKLRHKDMSS